MTRGGLCQRNKKKIKKRAPRRKERTPIKAQFSFLSRTISNTDTEDTTSGETSTSESSTFDHVCSDWTIHNGDGPEITHAIKTGFQRACDYRKCHLKKISSKYDCIDSRNTGNVSKWKMAQIKLHTYDHFDPIYITGFLCGLKFAFDTNEIHEAAAMKLFHTFMKYSGSSALHTRWRKRTKPDRE